MKLFGSLKELVAIVWRKNSQEITLRPNQATTYTANRDIQTPPQDADSVLVSANATQTLSNKTLDNTSTVTVKDTLLTIQDDGDTSKQAKFQASGITTATTRTFTFPDANTTLVGTDATQSLTNKTLDNTNTVTLKDTLLTIQDDGDTSKQAKFQASGITTATTRTFTFPDANTTLVGTDATQTITNKNLASSTNSLTGATAGNFTNTGTITLPTATTTLVGRDTTDTGANRLQNKELSDDNVVFVDQADTTKKAAFQVSGVTTGTTRTLTVPDASTTILGTDATQVITNKDIDGGTATNTRRITLPKETTTNLNALTRKQATLVFDTTTSQVKYDDGATLTALGASSTPLDSPMDAQNYTITVTPTANTYVIALKTKAGTDPTSGDPVKVAFRNATAATGDYSVVSATAATSITISSGATLGFTTATAPIYVHFLNNAGTIELAVAGVGFPEQGVQSTTVMNSSSDDRFTLYSTTARTNKAIRFAARILQSQPTPGTWTDSPSQISLNPYRIGGVVNMVKTDSSGAGAAGYGSTGTRIRRFTNVVTTNGVGGDSAINYTDSSTNGASFQVTESGVYSMYYSDFAGTDCVIGISKNASSLTTNIENLTAAEIMAIGEVDGTSQGEDSCTVTAYLNSGDVIRPHAGGGTKPATTTNLTQFCITQITRV